MANFIPIYLLSLLIATLACTDKRQNDSVRKPNIILVMADDLGWGDVGFNGNKQVKTPHLDALASKGVVFDRFYAASAVCSPTRASCLTGRNPFRQGIYLANVGYLKKEEITIPEVLKEHGYTTGHFGKWHVGTLSDSLPDGRRGGKDNEYFSPPWENGFDVCFSAEQAVSSWDPMKNQIFENPTRYWTGYRQFATGNLDGSNSRATMDRALAFIDDAVRNDQPFFAVIWFHTPHSPVVAGERYLEMYQDLDENKRHYYGVITDMDEQIGRLTSMLKHEGIQDNTLISFTSDNGPAGGGSFTTEKGQAPGGRNQGDTGGFRSRKGSLYEGGVRVPSFFVWPGAFPEGKRTDFPAVTSDFFPTILNLLDIQIPDRPIDGVDIRPAIAGKVRQRSEAIGFETPFQVSWVSQQYKLISPDIKSDRWELFDLVSDPYEERNLAQQHPDLAATMKAELEAWRASCRNSNQGKDYQHVVR